MAMRKQGLVRACLRATVCASLAAFPLKSASAFQHAGGGQALGEARPIDPVLAGKGAYRVLDNISGAWIHLNAVPVRPMVLAPDGLYALNTHDSSVQFFSDYSGAAAATWRVPWSPVSIALWTDPDVATQAERVLVACRGTYCLVFLDRSNGRIVASVPLPAEPGDMVVDEAANRAFVACSAADSVVEVDLRTERIAHVNAIPSKHPLFLALDGGAVRSTPLLSGNNSVVHKGGDNNRARGL